MKKSLWVSLLVTSLIVLDQFTKTLAETMINPDSAINLTSFLHLVNWRNEGAAFGMMKSMGNIFFITVAIFAIGFIIYLLLEGRESAFSLSLILAGALGNLIDRVRFGYVRDFIYISKGGFHWPAFNVADACLTVGVIVMFILPFATACKNRNKVGEFPLEEK